MESCNSFSLATALLEITLSASKNQKVQENCTKYLFMWWNRYQSVGEAKKQSIPIDAHREKLLISLPSLMRSHSSAVKLYYCLKELRTREVSIFMKQQIQVFTREKIRSLLLEHNVNEYTIKEMLGDELSKEKVEQSSSSYQSFQSFRKAQKEKEGIKTSPSAVITVL